jgi:hypothetical protein
MLDFTAVRSGETSFAALARDLSVADLHAFVDEMVDLVLDITAAATDADVVFEPRDPQANDNDGEQGWTLAHVVTHITAGAEETAVLATTLARGVSIEGRSRFEVPWETIQTAAQLRDRIEESRRMRHALLNAWPNQPHLELTHTFVLRFGPLNALGIGLLGLSHEQSHLDQLREIMRQAQSARG